MLTIITLLLIAALLTALLAYYYQKAAFEKKSQQQAKQALLKRSNQIKDSFKNSLERIASTGVLNSKSESAIYRLANYYFVFQTVNSQTVEQFSLLTKDLITTIDDKIMVCTEEEMQALQQQLERFAAALPKAAGGYTANFYHSDLPLLVFHLKQDPQPEPVQASDTPSEETQMAS
jgi:hypothetical protein